MTAWSSPARTVLATVATAAAAQVAVAAVCVPLKTDMVYDLSGALTFGLCTFVSLYYPQLAVTGLKGFLAAPLKTLISLPSPTVFHPRQLLLSGMTLIWASRLGSYLFVRAINAGGDPRFDKIKQDRVKFSAAFIGQILWVSLTALPVWAVNAVPARLQPALGWKDALGVGLWAAGFAYEVIADRQKAAFTKARKEKKTDDEFLRTGLWAKSRFPNYFGESLLWTGAYVASLGLLTAPGLPVYAPWFAVVAAAAPIFETLLITQVSGIPPIQRHHDKKHGKNPAYVEYKRNVPTFFPKLF
ncbi:hypothetical protein BDZ88DRAFT_444100 [Geranomyces variabilis]|nr:hypothetical protein BDZ88DRAFT_444100 [Geranomyces variabilis]KAJ3134605.1 hypothetical protein HDU90_004937 [Geranomyces variabilis]